MESGRILQIKNYLNRGVYPKNVKKSETRKRNFRRDCKKFFVNGGILFHRSKDRDLRVVSKEDCEAIEAEFEGIGRYI